MEIDTLLEALKDFEKKGKKELSPVLEQFLCHVAKTGETLVPWSQFKGYFIFKLEKVMDDFRASAPEQRGPPNPNVECVPFEEMKARILKIVNGYTGIPFTIQRLCELLTEPKRNYTGTEKFLRGVEKNVMVVSCVHPTSEKNGCGGVRMNGVMLPGNSSAFTERKVNGPGTPRPLNRQKATLSSSLATNGLPDSTENKDPNTASGHGKPHSDSPVSGPSRGLVRSKHPVKEEEEGVGEEEQPEVKRLKFLKDGEVGAEEDDDEEEDEEEDEADETAVVETLRPALAESSQDAQQAHAQSSASPDKQRHEEMREEDEEEEDSVPAGPAADSQDQEPSSTQTELCAEETKSEDKEAGREAKSEREVPSGSTTADSAEEPADMDQSEQRAPSGVAASPENREAGDESNEHVSSSSSSSSSSSCGEESEESAPAATPSDSTTEPPTEGAPESAAQDSASSDEPMEVD